MRFTEEKAYTQATKLIEASLDRVALVGKDCTLSLDTYNLAIKSRKVASGHGENLNLYEEVAMAHKELASKYLEMGIDCWGRFNETYENAAKAHESLAKFFISAAKYYRELI